MAARGFYEIEEGRSPDSPEQRCTFRVPIEAVKHLQRHGPKQKFHDLYLLKEALSEPTRIFKGLQRDEFEEAYAYISLPSKRYRSLEIVLPPPPGFVFVVFVRKDFIVMDWEWRKADESDSSCPKDWNDDFGEEVWSCN